MATNSTRTSSTTEKLTFKEHADVVSDVLFQSIGEGAIVIDNRGNISRVNKVALDILGFDAVDLIGKWFPATIVAEDESGRKIPNIERPTTEAFLTGQSVFKRVMYRRKDDSLVPVALTVSPIMLDDKPLGAIELFRDITDEIRLEHAKDEFISIASHQLRTPATVVKQYLGMILEGYAEDPAMQLEMLRTAYTHNNTQLEIINDLLKVAQIEANTLTTKYKETDLVALLHTIVHSQQPEFDKRGIGLQVVSAPKTAKVYVDPLHVQMVFENLINNANKYSPSGTTVTVGVAATPQVVTVHIKDQGIGIAPKDLPRLFNKFSRIENVNSTASGTGLGLYWAKKLVELYEGDINVTSQLGRGTTFSVCVPRKKQT